MRGYTSASTLAWVTIVLLSMSAALAAAHLVAVLWQVSLLNRMIGGEVISNQQAAIGIGLFFAIRGGRVVVFWLCAISFLAWLGRSYRNLPALGVRHLGYTPGWAVGAWFVPFLNLFAPYLIVKEVWRASGPDHDGSARWRSSRATPLVGFWWGYWLLDSGLSILSVMMLRGNPSDLPSLRIGCCVAAAALAVEIVDAILAILLVRSIKNRQETRYEVLLSAKSAAEEDSAATLADQPE